MIKTNREMRKEFAPIRRKMLKKYTCCQKCGSKEYLEVHHITPLALGGSNDESNLVVECCKCHEKEHTYSKSELIKAGMRRTVERNAEIFADRFRVPHRLVSYEQLNVRLTQLLEDGGYFSSQDLFEMIDSLDVVTNKDVNKETQDEVCEFWKEKYLERQPMMNR